MDTILDHSIIDNATNDLKTGAIKWVKGWGNRQTETCMHGALLRPCEHPGDAILWSRWATRQGFTEQWNDNQKTRTPVIKALTTLPEPTESDMTEWFGPNWSAIINLIRKTATITPEQAEAMGAAWDATRGATQNAAWGATRGATSHATRGAAWDAAWDATRRAARGLTWDATRGAAWDAAWDATRGATWGAAAALVARDLITPDQYATLTAQWVSVMGKTHPDDK